MKPSVALTLLVMGFLGFCRVIHAASFTFTTIDVPGSTISEVEGINAAGQIVGFYIDSASHGYGFLETNGTFTKINVPGSIRTGANGINNLGQIVGTFVDTSGTSGAHGFLETNGMLFTTIDAPDSTSASETSANGINDAGVIVGGCFNCSGRINGFVDINGVVTALNASFPGTLETQVYGINNADQIVGSYIDNTGQHGFLDTNGVFSSIDFPATGGVTQLHGINNTGEIVGVLLGVHSRGFVDSNGAFSTFDVPGATDTIPLGVNDSGQIVGRFFDSAGRTHEFLATPTREAQIPEPASSLLFASGLAGIIILILRKRMTRASTY